MGALKPWHCAVIVLIPVLLVLGLRWYRKRYTDFYETDPVPDQGVSGPDACPGCLGSGNSRHFVTPPGEDTGGQWAYRRCAGCRGSGRRFGALCEFREKSSF